jgi:hypothetical protein
VPNSTMVSGSVLNSTRNRSARNTSCCKQGR